MRILALVTEAFGGYGGIALYNRDLLTALCSHPETKEIVAIPRLKPEKTGDYPDNLTYITEGINNKAGYVKAVLKAVRSDKNFDLVVCGHINLLPVAFLLKLWLGKPVLLGIYGIDAWKPTRKLITDSLARKVDAFFSISELTRNRFQSWIAPSRPDDFILPNAIHTSQYSPGKKNSELLTHYKLEKKIVLMTLGRLVHEERYKGFDEILELLPELEENIVYLIIGKGPDRERLELKARKLGVKERVRFAGYVPEDQKADHYRLADVYVMPSRGEGFGFVFLEAMACGIPVIASKADGSREAVRNGSLGMLVDPDNRPEIKNAILETITKPRGIIPEGLTYFSYNNFASRLHKIVNIVLNKHKYQKAGAN